MNNAPKRRGQRSAFSQQPSEFRSVTEDEEFLARNKGQPRKFSEQIEDESQGMTQGGVVTYGGPGRVTMYCPTDNGWQARVVDTNSISQNLTNGWRSSCPDCDGHHGDGPNDCPGREPIRRRLCPICSASIWDNYKIGALKAFEEDDSDDVIRDDTLDHSTPETRTYAALSRHMWIRHPQEAEALNIAPPRDPNTTSVEQALQARMHTEALPGGNG